MKNSIFSPFENQLNDKKISKLNMLNRIKTNKIIFNNPNNLLDYESNNAKIINNILDNKKLRKNNKPSQTKNRLGRKKKTSNENKENIENNHNCNSADNLFYKLKVNCMKYILFLLNSLLRKYKLKGKFMKIEGKIMRDGSKLFNQIFINSSIKTILINYPLSKKYKITEPENNNNHNLIERIEKSKLNEKNIILEILNNTFYKIYENEYCKFNDKQYFEKYNIKFKNKYLLNHHFNNQTHIKDFVNYGILSYLEKKKERATIYKDYFKIPFQQK